MSAHTGSMTPDPLDMLRKIERELRQARASGSFITLAIAADYACGVATDTLRAHAVVTFIYGPAKSGKTRNREAFRTYFGCGRVVDDWSRRDQRMLEAGDLVLTKEQPPYGLRTTLRQRSFHIRDALRLVPLVAPLVKA